MKGLEKAIKTYWYSRGFNKAPDTGGWYQMELDAFSEGWKAALHWEISNKVEVKLSPHPDATPFEIVLVTLIEEELNAKT